MIQVTAAVIRDGEKVMICKRPQGKRFGGQWEFPGGKVEPGETLFDCIKRECMEELCIVIEPQKEIVAIEIGDYIKAAYYGDGRYLITFPKTPSDNRTGKNLTSEIINICF